MSALTFSRSKRHNVVEVAITYEAANDRNDFQAELAFVQELSAITTACVDLHKHGRDPIVPQYRTFPDTYVGSIDLRFPIKTSTRNEKGDITSYSWAALHATLKSISEICARHRSNFIKFGCQLNLAAMTSPWVLPIDQHGVIARNGAQQLNCVGLKQPKQVRLSNGQLHDVEGMTVIGEPLAVDKFRRKWAYRCEQFRNFEFREFRHRLDHAPVLDLTEMERSDRKIQWQNIAVFAKLKGMGWYMMSEGVNVANRIYLSQFGNDMMMRSLGFDNDHQEAEQGLLLHDHAYFSFEEPEVA